MAVARARWPLAKTPSAFQGEFLLAAGDLSRRILALEHAHERARSLGSGLNNS